MRIPWGMLAFLDPLAGEASVDIFGEPRVVDRDTIVIRGESNRLEGHYHQGRSWAEASEAPRRRRWAQAPSLSSPPLPRIQLSINELRAFPVTGTKSWAHWFGNPLDSVAYSVISMPYAVQNQHQITTFHNLLGILPRCLSRRPSCPWAIADANSVDTAF